jgi:peptidoglycan/LPS O-acetylase OafA/YrhL
VNYLSETELQPASNKKNVTIDSVTVLTVVCVFLVLLLHQVGYTRDLLSHLRPFRVNDIIQRFAVGGFIFLSGFKLTKSKLKTNIKDFLMNRISKIYFLYLFAIVISSFTSYPHLNEGNLPSFKGFLIHSLALQAFFPDYFGEDFHALWFVSVLLICYLSFILFRKWLTHLPRFIFLASVFILSISVLRMIMLNQDIALFRGGLEIWLAIFFAGMICASQNWISATPKSHLILSKPAITIGIIIGIVELFCLYNYSGDIPKYLFDLLELIGVFLAIIPAFVLFLRQEFVVHPQLFFVFKYIEAASYCMFLLHRPIWAILSQIWSDRSIGQVFFILGLGIPLIIYVSYITQVSYTRLTKISFQR